MTAPDMCPHETWTEYTTEDNRKGINHGPCRLRAARGLSGCQADCRQFLSPAYCRDPGEWQTCPEVLRQEIDALRSLLVSGARRVQEEAQ